MYLNNNTIIIDIMKYSFEYLIHDDALTILN